MTTPKDEFESFFVHKGEECDDPPETWAWTIKGSYPIEVWAWFEDQLTTARQEGEQAERERILNNVSEVTYNWAQEDVEIVTEAILNNTRLN